MSSSWTFRTRLRMARGKPLHSIVSCLSVLVCILRFGRAAVLICVVEVLRNALYTEAFYQLLLRRLTPGGVFATQVTGVLLHPAVLYHQHARTCSRVCLPWVLPCTAPLHRQQGWYPLCATSTTSLIVALSQCGPGSEFNATECFTAIHNTLERAFDYVVAYTADVPSFGACSRGRPAPSPSPAQQRLMPSPS
jgi:spermidine synthase